jgi:hypothetical protein
VREPEDDICPASGEGDLVVSEIRKSGDPDGTWIEVYNAGGASVDLQGMVVRMISIDGGTELRMLVRDALSLAGGDYAVLGDFPDETKPAHVDYGFGADFDHEAPSSGAVQLFACGVEIDRAEFELPTDGSYSFGTTPPTAGGNDEESAWCTGAETGTPGSENPACP